MVRKVSEITILAPRVERNEAPKNALGVIMMLIATKSVNGSIGSSTNDTAKTRRVSTTPKW